jgi:hypothetical protein
VLGRCDLDGEALGYFVKLGAVDNVGGYVGKDTGAVVVVVTFTDDGSNGRSNIVVS